MNYYIIKIFILYIILSLTNNICLAGTTDPATPDEKYVEYGKDFHYIYKLIIVGENKIIHHASAVAINDHWLLTAAHIIPENINTELYISNIDKKIIKINKIIPHEEFKSKNFGYNDVALCYTEESLGLDFYPKLYESSDEVNKICSISGFGKYGNFNTGAISNDDKRRAGSNIISSIDRHLMICTPSTGHIDKKTDLEFIIAHGDSGGGLFIDQKLAGINSCVIAIDKNPNSNYTDEAGHTRVSQFIDWIKRNMN